MQSATPRTQRPIPLLALVLLTLLGACGSTGAEQPTPPAGALVAVNGTHLFVHHEGSGDPLVVVHGGPLLDHGYILPPLRPLAADFELVLYDQRLSGRSDGAVDSASVNLDTFVADIDGVRRALGLDRVHLLGHSWGGLLAMKYALDYPDRVRSLVLVSPMAPSAALWQEEEAALGAALEPADTAGMGELRASAALAAYEPAAIERLLQLSFRAQLHDPARADQLRFHIPDDYGERGRQFAYLAPDLSSYDLTGALEGLQVPTLLVYGASEAGAHIGAGALAASVPDITIEVIEGAGHFAFFERPERFRRAVREFLGVRAR